MKRKLLLCTIALLLLLHNVSVAQSLVINEVSNGGSGNKEFVELVVIGTCGQRLDIRGYYFDDNCATPGNTAGSARFTNNAQWAAVPVGTIIVLYNGSDLNEGITGADLTDSNCDGVYFIPITAATASLYIETQNTAVGGCAASNYTTTTNYGVSNIWDRVAFSNTADLAQIRDASGNAIMSVGYGTGIASPGGTFISFAAVTGSNRTFQNTGNDASLQANWASTSPVAGTQSPGYPNSCTNALWIEAMRSVEDYDVVNMQAFCSNVTLAPFSPVSCAATAYADYSTGCTANSYAWLSSNPAVATISATGATPTITQLTNGTTTITGTITKTHSSLFAGPNTTVGCSATPKEITVTQDIIVTDCAIVCPSITATISGAGGFCGSGNTGDGNPDLSVAITGGTGPYTVEYDDQDNMNAPYAPITNYVSGTTISRALLSTTTFTLVSVTDANNCPATTLAGSATFFVSQNAPEVTVSSFTNPTTCSGTDGTAQITTIMGGMGPYTVTWSTMDGSGFVQGSFTQNMLSAGTYEVIIQDANGCISDEPFFFELENPVGCAVCDITSVTFINQGTCNDNDTPANTTDDYYTADVVVSFVNPPPTGFLQIEPGGDAIGTYSIAVGSLVGNTHTFTGVQLKADGTQTVIEVEFTIPANICFQMQAGPTVQPCSVVCPGFGGGSHSLFVCSSGNISLTVTGLSNMSQAANGSTDYGISFVVFTSAVADPYTGGTLLGTVPFASLGGGGTSATLTIANPLIPGSYVAYAILSPTPGSAGCRPNMSYAFQVVATPTAYDVTGGGSTCENNGAGFAIGLSDSDIGFTYDLLLNATPPAVATQAGTGNALNFGNFTTAGTYTVVATNNAGGSCTAQMSGSAVISALPESPVPTVVSPVVYCQNDMALPLTAGGVNLLWYSSLADPTGDPVAPTPSTAAVGNTSYFVSQTTSSAPPVSVLAPGDIAIIGYLDNTTPDVFAFVPFVNLAAGTVIYFTDNGWTGTNFQGVTMTAGEGNEDIMKYVAPANVPAGTVIYSNNPGFVAEATPIPGATGAFRQLLFNAMNGDQIYAFQGGTNNPQFNITTHLFVFDDTGVFENAGTASQGSIPPGLTAGVTANTFSLISENRISLTNDGMSRTPAAWLSYIAVLGSYTTGTGMQSLNIPNLNVTLSGGSSLCESDKAEIVVTIQEPATATIAAIAPVCVNSSISLFGTLGGGASSGTWSANIMGGTFAPNNTNTNVTYTPPANFTGNIIFTFTTNDPAGPCPAAVATRTVEVQTGGVNAGPDQVICSGETVLLDATLSAGATTPVTWTPNPAGGTFAPNNTTVDVNYTPPVGFSGLITLTLAASSTGACPNPQDQLVLTVLPASAPPTVVTPVIYCQNAPAVALTATGTNLLWYSSLADPTGDPVAPTPSTAAMGNTSYFVTQTLNTAPPVSVLAPGDLAIIALKDNTPDIFAFAPLVNLAAGTVIYFTDNGWTGTSFRGTVADGGSGPEGLMRYTAPSVIPAGTVIYNTDPAFSLFNTPIPPGGIGNFDVVDFNAAGDQVYAFQNSDPNNPLYNTATQTHLFVFDDTGDGFEVATTSNEGGIPPGLTLGSTALTFAFAGNNISALNNDNGVRTPAEWITYVADPMHYAQIVGQGTVNIPNLRMADLCESPRAEIVVTVRPAPGVFTVTGGGDICNDDPIGGLPVGLSDSETGVNYQLQLNNVNVGGPVAGTGNAISFGNQPASPNSYTVIATVVASGCTIAMSGSVQVTAINCRIEITDPCICKNNATNLLNGQFDEVITIFAITGQTWTLIANTGLYLPSSPNPPGVPTLIPTNTVITESPAGSGQYVLRGVHIDDIGYSITVRNDRGQVFTIGNSCAYPNPAILSNLDGPFCLYSEPIQLLGDPGDDNVISAGFFINGIPATVFDPGALGVGTYVIQYIVDGGEPMPANDDPGCVYRITRVVQVVTSSANLVCNDQVTVSLEADCSTEVTPDMVLEGSFGCFDDYVVEIDRTLPLGNGPWLPGVVGADDIGTNYAVRVRHLISGNTCWGHLRVEDKVAPLVTCESFDVPCNVPDDSPDYLFLNGFATLTEAYPTITECDDYTTIFKDTEEEQSCASGFTKILTRTWTVTDASGNKAACTQTIRFFRPTLADLDLPENYDGNSAPYFTCTGPYPTPEWITAQGREGTPTVFEQVEGCNIGWTYVDDVIDVCDGTYKILRKWTIVDWCTNGILHYTQLIKVVDDVVPVMTCPATPVIVSTDQNSCCATVDLPDLIIEDGCSRINHIQAMVTTFDPDNLEQTAVYTVPGTLGTFQNNNIWDRDTMARFGIVQNCLPLGTHRVMYTAVDDCGNAATCSFQLVVQDLVPPSVSCTSITKVGLSADSMAIIPAIALNSGTYDNCSPVFFKARRVLFNECQDNIFYHDSLTFCCSDIGSTIMVELRAWDVPVPAGDVAPNFSDSHANSCMVSVLVEDKIKPTCEPPAHVTISCENFDPTLWAYGFAESVDNCCLDTITVSNNLAQFDTTCNRGTIIRTFRAYDCAGQSSVCTQRIKVDYNQNYYLKLPDDKTVYSCNGSPNSFGQPSFFGEDCELLAISYDDVYFTVVPDACYKIERTWTIINWCTFDPDEPCIIVPNPNPSVISNDPANVRAPILSPHNTPVPWAPTVVYVNPGDPAPTNYADLWDPGANCYKYKQIIKVLDVQDPVFEACPESPVDLCDVTNNDSLLWNFDYWWDNTLQTHDLCEGPADLKVSALDSCSGTNIRFRYLLFLDLDNDGEMESVVSSTQPPAPGTIHYGNINTPNFQGGEIRQFQQNLPPSQRFRFTILEHYSPDATHLIANLRFNTQQLPNVYTIPQLPHGRHKIKWIVEDLCGNETVCEYEFEIRDCKPPTVACENININLMLGGSATLWANDFFEYGEDNCTPANILNQSLAIIRDDANPDDTYPGGAPNNQSIDVTCLDEGQAVPVQIWLQDAAQPGNADFCIAYVNVQANIAGCEGFTPAAAVAGALTMQGQGVEQASVEINGTPNVNAVQTTGNNGTYHFASIPLGADVTVTPTKDDNPLNGVSTYDLVQITKHILGLEPLTTPYKMIAADANRSGSITSFDIVEFRKLILGIYNELPNNTSWRFVEKAYVFPNPANPFGAPFPENISLSNLATNMLATHFEGVKIGDVNGTAIANSLYSVDDRTAATMLFDVEDRAVKAGEVFTVNFKGAERVQGYQFTLNFNELEVLDIMPGTDMNLDNFGVFTDAITTSVDGAANEFAVTFRAAKAGQISQMLGVSSRITKAEAYGPANERLDVAFRFNNGSTSTISGVGFELYQNQPNPFVNKTFIGFHLPEATSATLRIFDETGRMVFTQNGDFAKGYNTISVDRALLNTTGVLYYTLETATDSATKKMIQSK